MVSNVLRDELGERNSGRGIPSSEDVMMESSWKPSQQIGSSPTILDCASKLAFLKIAEYTQGGGSYHDRW